MREKLTVIIATFFCLAIWCVQESSSQESSPATRIAALRALTPEQAVEARRAIITWLECEECNQGELRAVVRLGPTVVPTLAATLKEGPSQASLEFFRRYLIATYRSLKKFESTHHQSNVLLTETDYVNQYLDNYLALYQIRAAEALAAIGGPAAKTALKEAMQLPLRPDVSAKVHVAWQRTR